MSGHLCASCHSEEATIQETSGNRIRFCGESCQASFYAGIKSAPIGAGLLDEIHGVPEEGLHDRMEAIFRPYIGPDLPGIIAIALDNRFRDLEVEGVVPSTAVTHVKALLGALFNKEFLGWKGQALLTATFNYALEHNYPNACVLLFRKAGPANTEIWGLMHVGDSYDPVRVSHVFTRLEAMPLDARRFAAKVLASHTVPSFLTEDSVHFARQAIRLCTGADAYDDLLKVFERAARMPVSVNHEIIAVAGEAGAREVFGHFVEALQGDVIAGLRNPRTDRTVVLARKLALENGWE